MNTTQKQKAISYGIFVVVVILITRYLGITTHLQNLVAIILIIIGAYSIDAWFNKFNKTN